MTYKIGIIGCGLIGNKRAASLKNISNSQLIMVADINKERAKELALKYNCESIEDWKKVTRNKDINMVILATTNEFHAEIAIDAIKNGKHVLIEKPGARTPQELETIREVLNDSNVKVKVGYNLRFHPAIQKAKEIVDSGDIGTVMNIRIRFGHGARKDYNKEWRAFKKTAGGGAMLDLGLHQIDLAQWFMGDIQDSIGYCANHFWDMEVEDNCFALLRTRNNQIAQLHASCTQWKNIFSMEIFCETGLLIIDGLGKSYGTETLTFYKMKPEMGIPDKFIYEFPGEDISWEKELKHFITTIENKTQPMNNLDETKKIFHYLFDIYEWDKKNKIEGG